MAQTVLWSKKTMQSTITERRHDLDWLRFIAIVILLFFHTGMIFNKWGFHIKNTETTHSFGYWMVLLHFCRMPLLLFISGAGTYMALAKRTSGQFAGERFKRLMIPLIFGMFVIVPPQIYFEYIARFTNYWDFYKTVFEFQPYPGGSFSWHHLWFILYLFIYSLIAVPFLTYLRSPKSQVFREKIWKVLGKPAGMLLFPAAIILITQIVLRPFFPEETHALVNDWAYFAFYFCFFIFGMMCYSNQHLWLAIQKNRRYLLGASIFIMIPFYLMFMNYTKVLNFPWSVDVKDMVFEASAMIGSWFWVITIVAFGQHYLNKPYRWLSVINEGVYPFYILHQTAIIAIGYYICKLDWSITAKFWSVSLLSGISCIAIYLFLIRPSNGMRLFFGMKPKAVAEAKVSVQPLQVTIE
jgi:glucans biosynthesis protein C